MSHLVAERIFLKPGDWAVCKSPAELSTILGSCVAVCFWDSTTKLAGMNHFLLAEPFDKIQNQKPIQSTRYASKAIQVLMNEMLQCGATRKTIVARVAGGGRPASLIKTMDVGRENRCKAESVLDEMEIPVVETVYPDKGIKVRLIAETGKLEVSSTSLKSAELI